MCRATSSIHSRQCVCRQFRNLSPSRDDKDLINLYFNSIMGTSYIPEPQPEVPAAVPEPVPAAVPEPEPEVPVAEPEPEVDDEEDVPVARSAALIEEALNAQYSKAI